MCMSADVTGARYGAAVLYGGVYGGWCTRVQGCTEGMYTCLHRFYRFSTAFISLLAPVLNVISLLSSRTECYYCTTPFYMFYVISVFYVRKRPESIYTGYRRAFTACYTVLPRVSVVTPRVHSHQFYIFLFRNRSKGLKQAHWRTGEERSIRC